MVLGNKRKLEILFKYIVLGVHMTESAYKSIGMKTASLIISWQQSYPCFIGIIVRDGKNVPLIYKDWDQVRQHYKDHIWAIIQVMKHDFV